MEINTKLAQIKLAVFDVDGVLTDAKLYFNDESIEHKAFNARDGLGIKLLMDNAVEVAIITGRKSKSARARLCDNLGVKLYYEGSTNKLNTLKEIVRSLNISLQSVLYVGDDLIDLEVMNATGIAVAVSDAEHLIKQHADIVLQKKGGEGAVREICENILQAQGKWEKIVQQFKQGIPYTN